MTTWHRPDTLAEAQRLMADDGAMAITGGQIVVPALYRRDIRPAALVDLTHVLDDRVEVTEHGVRIGALARHADLIADPRLTDALPILPALLAEVADPAVRSRATMGGSVAAREKASDIAALCLALGATVETTGGKIAAMDWFDPAQAPMPGEIVTALHLPSPRAAAYAKFLDPAARYPMVGVFLARLADGTHRVARTGLRTDGPQRWSDGEQALAGGHTLPDAPGIYAEALGVALLNRVAAQIEITPDTALSLVHGQVLPAGVSRNPVLQEYRGKP